MNAFGLFLVQPWYSYRPYGISTDSSGNVYVADTYNRRIQKFVSTGQFISKWGSSGSGDGQFNYPSGIAIDSSGNVCPGIRVILKTQKALKQRNGRVVLMNLQPQVKKVFEIINVLPSLSVFASIEELDQYLDHVQRKITEKA